MFETVLFLTGRKWKQLNVQGEWLQCGSILELWNTTQQYKKNNPLIHTRNWVALKALCESVYITFLKQRNYRDGDQISGCQGLEMVRSDGWG